MASPNHSTHRFSLFVRVFVCAADVVQGSTLYANDNDRASAGLDDLGGTYESIRQGGGEAEADLAGASMYVAWVVKC